MPKKLFKIANNGKLYADFPITFQVGTFRFLTAHKIFPLILKLFALKWNTQYFPRDEVENLSVFI